jgi:hypothetical protein
MISYASRPSRIFVRSDDAIDRAGTGTPSNFVLPLIENILDAKAVQLLSCRIPNCLPQIPDYQRYFIYLYDDGVNPTQIRAFMLDHNVPYSTRYYADYSALVARLNIDAQYWIPYTPGTKLSRADFLAAVAQPSADVQFGVSTVNNKITISAVLAGVQIFLGSENNFTQVIVPQEVIKNYLYLNFLLGFETRPSALAVLPPLTTLNPYNDPPGWASLVYTQTIYIKTNMVMNGTYTSNGQRDILQTIPVTVPPLAIIAYQSSQRHWIYSVPNTIGTITITLIDENGQEIFLPENAQTEFEIGLIYEGENV